MTLDRLDEAVDVLVRVALKVALLVIVASFTVWFVMAVVAWR